MSHTQTIVALVRLVKKQFRLTISGCVIINGSCSIEPFEHNPQHFGYDTRTRNKYSNVMNPYTTCIY
jgi:hypothetical protein